MLTDIAIIGKMGKERLFTKFLMIAHKEAIVLYASRVSCYSQIPHDDVTLDANESTCFCSSKHRAFCASSSLRREIVAASAALTWICMSYDNCTKERIEVIPRKGMAD